MTLLPNVGLFRLYKIFSCLAVLKETLFIGTKNAKVQFYFVSFVYFFILLLKRLLKELLADRQPLGRLTSSYP